ncbi:MAG: deoxyribose-phosphate aldolase [Bdellovibrionota bacterium]
MQKYTAGELAKFIDHTLLKADATSKQIQTLCEEALKHHFFGVCVNSSFVSFCSQTLSGTGVHVVSVVGFPLGAMGSLAKAYEAEFAVNNGASEVDMVLNLAAIKEKNYKNATNDIQQVVKASRGKIVKVILETNLLTNEEKIAACQCSQEAGAHFVKTNTGFSGGGATLDDVLLMKKTVGSALQVKASGGIKNTQQALEYLNAGVSRLGTSSGIALIQGLDSAGGY